MDPKTQILELTAGDGDRLGRVTEIAGIVALLLLLLLLAAE